MFYVYVLKSLKTGTFYKGQTNNIEKRLYEHLSGQVKSTIKLVPIELFFVQICESRSEAMNMEKFLKSGHGRDFIKFLVEHDDFIV